jgi:TolB-like protein/Tfp pilus assembly protein PilF/predicted Ser/Thr protein kinase
MNMIGKTISHYRIVEKLGEGGMGVVYKAHDTALDRDVALKFLPPYLTSDSSEKERFYHEARTASALSHQNITTIHEISEYEGRLFIAMECVEGRTLKELVESELLSIKKALDIALQVADGLAAAHEKGIVHRDIKSENVMLTPKGQAKIMDFGLAKMKGAAKITKEGSTLGTAAYMSPEQAEGEEVDARSDIFSFGVVLYELLTGKLPFRGEHQAALLYSILNEEPPPLARFNEKAGDELQRIVSKALAKEKDERYQHVDDMLADLRRERKTLEYARTGYVRVPTAAGAGAAPVVGAPTGAGAGAATAAPKEAGAAAATAATAAPAAKPKRKITGYLIPAAIVVVAVVLLIILNPFNFQIGLRKTVAQDKKSVAVLPFTNMSGSKDDEFFSDGITEDIIAQLSNIADLKVISRTSVMRYKNTSKSVRDIASELDVATILEGSVRRVDNQVRIVAQLIDAASDRHLWAETYDKELTQVFAIQSDVAQQIASALQAKLSPREKEQLGKKPTENLDAYAYYLKGRDYYYRYTYKDNENAIELFKKALELDPNYALAYAGLGDAYEQRVRRFGFPPVWNDSSIAVSNKAISIDPNLAEGYKALGLAYGGRGWIRKSLEAYRKAVDLNPNYQPALGNIGHTNLTLGKLDEGLQWSKRSLALDPMIANSYLGVGGCYLFLGDDAKATEWFNKALVLQPDLTAARFLLAQMRLLRGEGKEGLEEAQRILSVDANAVPGIILAGYAEVLLANYAQAEEYFEKINAIDSSYATTVLGFIYMKTGRPDEAREMFSRSLRFDEIKLENGNEDPDVRYDIASVKAMQGNSAEAYEWLQKAIDSGWTNYRLAELDPSLDSIRNEDRFKQMMAGVKARVDEMRRRVEETEKEESSGTKQG